jgi:acetyltransferase AlgX (SGNH hydrolase-like protein)
MINISRHKMLVMSVSMLILCLVISWIVYGLFGHHLIESMYRGESFAILNDLMKGRTSTPLEIYYEEASRLMWKISLMIGISFIVIQILVYLGFFKKIVYFSLFFIFYSFLFFCLLEYFPTFTRYLNLHSVPYYAYKENYISDDVLGFREKPLGQYKVSNFRGDKYSPIYRTEVPPLTIHAYTDEEGFSHNSHTGSSDVIVIGDSYIASGLNEADSFGSMLERRSGLTVANLGVGGYGPFQYLEVLKRYGLKRKPKYALFAFFEGNDISDIKTYLLWKNGAPYNTLPIGYRSLSDYFILRRYFFALTDISSYLSENLKEKIAHLISNNDNQYNREGEIHPDLALLRLRNETHKVLLYYKIKSNKNLLNSEEGIALRKILMEFRSICIENDITPIMVYIPIAAHIYAEYSTYESGTNWLKIREEQIATKANVENAINHLVQELHIPFINLVPAFEAAAKDGKLLYYPFDTHWNSEGRAVAAAYVADMLKHKFVKYSNGSL